MMVFRFCPGMTVGINFSMRDSMTTITFGNGTIREIPSSWEELTAKEIRRIVKTYYRCMAEGKSLLEFNVRVLFYFLGIDHDWRSIVWERLHPEAAKDRDANIYMLCERCLGWLFSDGEGGGLAFSSLVNALPTFRTGFCGRRWIGPADGLTDISFGEFRRAATALNAFFKSQRPDDIDECIAFLYRPRSRKANKSGRKVRGVTPEGLARDKRHIARLAAWKKGLIALWFAACVKFVQSATIHIDGEDIDMGRLYSGEGTEKGEFAFSWNDLLIEVAKEQSIGSMERVDEEPLYSVFVIMWHNYKERKRLERRSSQT